MKKDKREISIVRSSAAEYLTFVASTGDSKESIEMRYEDENIWLTQKMMAVLYDVDVRTVNEHIQKIYADDELTMPATIRKFRIVQDHLYQSDFDRMLLEEPVRIMEPPEAENGGK